jgi:hypothetical protein
MDLAWRPAGQVRPDDDSLDLHLNGDPPVISAEEWFPKPHIPRSREALPVISVAIDPPGVA